MPASLVQSSSLVVGGYPSVSTSFSTTPTVGGTVLVTGTYSPSFGTPPTGVSITDNQGNTYSVLRSVSSIGDSGAFIGYAAIGTASGTFTVTATVTGGSADAGVMVSAQEWSGLDNTGLLDQQGAATLAFGTGTDQTVTASGANSAADRVVIGVLASRNSASISSVQNSPPITGYTNIYSRLTVSFGEPGGLAAYKIVSATETSSVNWGEVTGGGFISALQLATFVVTAGGSPTNYTLTCDAGSYATTGQDAQLRRGYRITSDVGAYASTGIDAALRRGYRVVADVGAYTSTGQDAALRRGYRLTADVGAYALTGQDATLIYSAGAANYTLACDVGAYALTGYDATLTYAPGTTNYTLACDVGAYSLTGQSAVTSLGRRLIADVGAYASTGQAATPIFGRRLVCDTGAYTLTGYDATLTATVSTNYSLTCETGAYTLTGRDANLIFSGAFVDTHDGFWVREYRKMFERKPTIAEVVEIVQERPQEAIEAVREVVEQKYPDIDYTQVLNSVKIQRFIAKQLLIALELKRIEDDEQDIEDIFLLL